VKKQALESLAMFLFTSNSPPSRVEKSHLQRCFARLGVVSPSRKVMGASLLKECQSKCTVSLMRSRYAVVTDGWTKRTAKRGTPLINVMVFPDDRPAVFLRVVDAGNQIKHKAFVVELHQV
jgi:hypothetical protein